ncbi:MAG: phosphoenolpyruvate carboxykinase (ATP) [Candidatus Delongbacteria bacterium]|nr:phosphoenolpyruvate carboxykinase (ATP) [Candidatus Delongbacteria bacterium]
MSTYGYLKSKSFLSPYRAIIETCFHGNQVHTIPTVQEAYRLAHDSPGTIVTDIPIYQPETNGFPAGAKILVFNDGEVFGRAAQARRIAGTQNLDEKKMQGILREAAYHIRYRTMYHCQTVIGLDEEFMVKAHLLIPEHFENTALNWMINFQELNTTYRERYQASRSIDEPDIMLVSDPEWSHPDFPLGIAFFDPTHNCAMLLGMRYFGEHKKGTLTLAWNVANRNGYASCHGGLKSYDDRDFVLAAFGLSGSGKSTITHSKHAGQYRITVLHDDAFVINTQDYSTIALEPTYFDKTSDYAIEAEDNKYILTAQNVGVTLDAHDRKILVTEDIRNGNGRAIKSRLWSPNRVDRISKPLNAILWLMKDPTLPPVVKIKNPILASVMGATLATKRTLAERVINFDPDKLVIEPYANPFRTYPLSQDYYKFKQLIEQGIDCFIINTGDFLGKKVTKETTLGIIESIVEKKADFQDWEKLEEFFGILSIPGFMPPMNDPDYQSRLRQRFQDRIEFIQSRESETAGFDTLPEETTRNLETMIAQLQA